MSEETKTKSDHVASSAARMLAQLSNNGAVSKNLLSLLRKSFATGEEDPEALGWMLTQIPEEISGKGGNLSREEKAIYLTLCIFGECRGKTGHGQDLILAAKEAGISQKRLMEIELANNLDELKTPLCLLVQYISSKGIQIDYIGLAKDLTSFQYDRSQIVRKWVRKYATSDIKEKGV